ncbi:alpha carbonic anhydrase 4-like [Pistacia vera]|uniref:alpha carbonic anhydrase 4-like n=1 Tax=Pistacia vera TaxID=55513 RepID=UPI001263E1D8|nr:alpha carbonic anhydrase 4-like [Pistacia vera]
MLYNNKSFIFFIFTSLLLSSHLLHFISAYASQHEDHETPFSYSEGTGKGPKSWGNINPNWRTCGNGKMQSPIDLVGKSLLVSATLGKLKRDYNPASAVLQKGHFISVKWKGDAGQININGTYYKLVQCHWHTPSEHTFNGSRYELELHMVHVSSDNKKAVIGIVYEYGHPDPFLSRLFPYIKSLGEKEKEIRNVNPGDVKFGSRKYYRYIGSLSTPPCTEGVIWTIVNKVRTVSREQVRALKEKVEDGFVENARPTQQLKGRAIWFYSP